GTKSIKIKTKTTINLYSNIKINKTKNCKNYGKIGKVTCKCEGFLGLMVLYHEKSEPLNENEAEQMMKEADKDADGTIDYEEFVAMMTGDSFKINE
ncbi:calglandulin, partial [Triplophysa rosa]